MNRFFKHTLKNIYPAWGFLLLFFLFGQAFPRIGSCDLYIEFLVDRSGSMWSSFYGKPKIIHVTETIERFTKDLPADVAIGLRTYPLKRLKAVPGQQDPGLRIPMAQGNRDRFVEELPRLNPQGKAVLAEHLNKALNDFPKGEDTKLLILLCDGADNRGISFCDRSVASTYPEGLRFLTVSLNLKDETEQEQLNCLGKQFSGKVRHLVASSNLFKTIMPVCRKAHKDELARQTRVKEEQKRLADLMSKTRLKAEFHNTLDSFFADSIEVIKCLIDGEDIALTSSAQLSEGETSLLFDKAVKKGQHKLSLQYKKWRDNRASYSSEDSLDVEIKEGKTSHIIIYPKGTLFHWGCQFKPYSP